MTEREMKDNQAYMKKFVLHNLGKVPDWVPAIIEKTKEEDILVSPIIHRPPWQLLWAEISKGNVCVVGDAFHPMTSDIGQGGCSALEDAVVLARFLGHALSKKYKDQEREYEQIKTALSKYAQERKWRAIGLVATARLVGHIEQNSGNMMSLIRDYILPSFLDVLMVKIYEYDCGKLPRLLT